MIPLYLCDGIRHLYPKKSSLFVSQTFGLMLYCTFIFYILFLFGIICSAYYHSHSIVSQFEAFDIIRDSFWGQIIFCLACFFFRVF